MTLAPTTPKFGGNSPKFRYVAMKIRFVWAARCRRVTAIGYQPAVASATTSSVLLLLQSWCLSGQTWAMRSNSADAEYAWKLEELDRLLNDPAVPMEPAKVWSLLAEIAQRDRGSTQDAEPGDRQQKLGPQFALTNRRNFAGRHQ